ncbi:MAG: 16S rRNA (guanine(966)-N(2))-methyltransferase RsmD [Bacteroidales bacterium]|nr:16S rRNA (guanine(966)-N(2))-methyltransferase RsmD [Bacteroidales bacterium]
MRIISGKNRGRHIVAPDNLPVRPTTDLGKESLFNILNNYFYLDQVKVLDLFSGTGNLTYEFASRGAVSVIAVDADQRCTNFIKKTIASLQYNNVAVIRQDAFAYTAACRQKFDIIFADPPYQLEGIEKIVDNVFAHDLLNPDGWLILEHSKEHVFTTHPKYFDHRRYGKLNFTFFVNMTEDEGEETEKQEQK